MKTGDESNKIRIAITDDHELVRTGLKNTLAGYADLLIEGEYEKGSHLLDGLRKIQPDILFLDLQLPDKRGEELLGIIKKHYPSIKVIVLTSNESLYQIKVLLAGGADGYIFKNAAADQLREAIDHVSKDSTTPYLQKEVRETVHKANRKDKAAGSSIETLTPREIEILKLIAREMTSQEIGAALHIHYRTVEIYRLGIMRKLGAKNMVGMVKKAIMLGLILE